MIRLHALLQPLWSTLCFLLSTTYNSLTSVFRLHISPNRPREDGTQHLRSAKDTENVGLVWLDIIVFDHFQDTVTPPALETGHDPKPDAHDITYVCVSGSDIAHAASRSKITQPRHGEVIYVTKGKLIAWGGTTIVEHLPSGDVVKTPIPNPYCKAEEEDHRRNMQLEAQVYAIIGDHVRVPKLIHWDQETCCLTMEFLQNGSLKEYILRNNSNITPQCRLRWSIQAAEALTVLHSFQVVHCDLSPRNFLLDSNLDVKIADFGGASLHGSEPSATPASRFRHSYYDWDAPPVFGDDMFSLGSLIYFIMTGSYPYKDVASDEVEKIFNLQQFPDVSSLTCGTIILQAWLRQVDSAQVVYDRLKAIEKGDSQ